MFAVIWASIGLPQQAEPAAGTLRRYAQEERERGQSSVVLPFPRYEWAEVPTLNDINNQTSLITAQLLASVIVAHERDVVTWHKFRREETLVEQETVPPDSMSDAPSALLPLNPGEFLMPLAGGTVQVEGVGITMRPPHDPLPIGSQYLLFVTFFANGHLAAPAYGPNGLFTLSDAGEIIGIVRAANNSVEVELKRNNATTVERLKAVLAARSPH